MSKPVAQLWRSDRLCQQSTWQRTFTVRILHQPYRRQRIQKLRPRDCHKIQRLSRNFRLGARQRGTYYMPIRHLSLLQPDNQPRRLDVKSPNATAAKS